MWRCALAFLLWTIAIASSTARPQANPGADSHAAVRGGVAHGVPNPCGNGQRDGAEECDDGNQFDDDCCSAACLFTPANTRCNRAVDIEPSTQFAGPFADFVGGWEFTPQSPLTVVGLGVYDRDGDGFVEEHEVGLWLSSGDLQTSALVPTATTAPLADRFRYVPIDPFVLVPGQRYVVGALYRKMVLEWWATRGDITFDPRITFETGREEFQVMGLQLPSETPADPRLGPSLLLVGQCGDGVVDGGEECDDGNHTSLDGCSEVCVIDAPTPTATPTLTASPSVTASATMTVGVTRTNTPTATATQTTNPTVTVTRTLTVHPSITPTPTATRTATMSVTGTVTPHRSDTATATRTNTGTAATATRTVQPSNTETPTSTSVPASTSTPTVVATLTTPPEGTATPSLSCSGDCSGDGVVLVNELVLAVNIALEMAPVDQCRAGDANGNGQISVDELITGVNHALSGCPAAMGLANDFTDRDPPAS